MCDAFLRSARLLFWNVSDHQFIYSPFQCRHVAFFQRLFEVAVSTIPSERVLFSVDAWHRLSRIHRLSAGLAPDDLYPSPLPPHAAALCHVVSPLRRVRVCVLPVFVPHTLTVSVVPLATH